jgi:hypothetical protein
MAVNDVELPATVEEVYRPKKPERGRLKPVAKKVERSPMVAIPFPHLGKFQKSTDGTFREAFKAVWFEASSNYFLVNEYIAGSTLGEDCDPVATVYHSGDLVEDECLRK